MNDERFSRVMGLLSEFETLYGKARMKSPSNLEYKRRQEEMREISSAFQFAWTTAIQAKLAAREREGKLLNCREEIAALKLQIEQLKEARDKAVKNWEEHV